ncbi:hypothetical protein DL93DRAFT_239960 [Clavulina sp. PMI_390]|nr:hypothetical protein DL93DRAFT_239960 [Clavulina sp. PMI_390]
MAQQPLPNQEKNDLIIDVCPKIKTSENSSHKPQSKNDLINSPKAYGVTAPSLGTSRVNMNYTQPALNANNLEHQSDIIPPSTPPTMLDEVQVSSRLVWDFTNLIASLVLKPCSQTMHKD